MEYPVQTRFGLRCSEPVSEFERDVPGTFRTCNTCDTRVLLSTYVREHMDHDTGDGDPEDTDDADDEQPTYEDQFGLPVEADEIVARRYRVEISYEAQRVATVYAVDEEHAVDQIETDTRPTITHEVHRDVSTVSEYTAEEAAEMDGIPVTKTENDDT